MLSRGPEGYILPIIGDDATLSDFTQLLLPCHLDEFHKQGFLESTLLGGRETNIISVGVISISAPRRIVARVTTTRSCRGAMEKVCWKYFYCITRMLPDYRSVLP